MFLGVDEEVKGLCRASERLDRLISQKKAAGEMVPSTATPASLNFPKVLAGIFTSSTL